MALVKAVMYGAGNIGRGFIGQLFYESGYSVTFVDVNRDVIREINKAGRYPVRILYKDRSEEVWVENVSCVDGTDTEKVAEEIASADLLASAVGVNVLKFIAPPIAAGLKKRWEKGNLTPLNIIICENLIGADKYLKELVAKELGEEDAKRLDTLAGFVEASIGRMVPVQTPGMQEGNILRVCVEPYDKLPLDRAAFKGEIPKIKNAILYSPFEYYIERKLFIHNMGHAAAAYYGYLAGYEYIWEAIENPYIELLVLRAMTASALALSRRHKVDFYEVYEHVLDLIYRFGNRQLGDTVKRVGGDVRRKLSENDRLVGSYKMCVEQGVNPAPVAAAIGAALKFDIDEMIQSERAEDILKNLCRLDDSSILKFKEKKDLKEILEEVKESQAQ